jgi:hypothetical protein
MYTEVIYLRGDERELPDGSRDNPYNLYLLLGVIYPALYEVV